MSTWSSTAVKPERRVQVEAFRYSDAARHEEAVQSATADGQQKIESDIAQLEQKARDAGRQIGEKQAREQYQSQLQELRAGIASALTEFNGERLQYYRRIESEVVQLALSIARQILHREAQVDPRLLAGLVRVMLDKMETASNTTVRVNPQEVSDWQNYFLGHIEAERRPQLVADPNLPLRQCRLETSLGTVNLGMEVQLKEMEKGLMDLLAERPKSE